MTQKFDLSKMDITPMTEAEMLEMDGGNWIAKAVAAVVGGPVGVVLAVAGAVDAVIDLGKGAVAGWNSVHYK